MRRLAILSILILMATASAQPATTTVEQLARQAPVARALGWLGRNLAWVTDEQVRITEIPAPTYEEKQRAAYLKRLLEQAGLRAEIDAVGNVIAERPGAERGVVLVSAHLDTVFPAGAAVTVRRAEGRLYAPGISDNGTGLASLAALARALHDGRVRTKKTVVFAANVGEEGEGNLLGMRQLVQTYQGRLEACLVIDGSSTDHITSMALASRRFEVIVSGPGGHSWSDFGLPNPINALARGIVRFSRARVPENPRTSVNIGEIRGGTSVNSIPDRAFIKVDIRSGAEAEMDRLEKALREAMEGGAEEEMGAARLRRGHLQVEVRTLGVRPGGALPEDSPLLATVREVDRFLGNSSRLERSSTDANVPLSMGIPAVTLGGGGQGGGAHSPAEWYDPAGRELGLKRLLLTLVSIAGVEP